MRRHIIFFSIVLHVLIVDFAQANADFLASSQLPIMPLERPRLPVVPTPLPLLHQGTDYQRMMNIPGCGNNCFFAALRQLGIQIDRTIFIRLLEANRRNTRWVDAVLLLVQQEMFATDRPVPEWANTQPYDWFIEQIRGGAPITFRAYERPQNDLFDLLGEELGFDLRITQQETEQTLRVIRDFTRPIRPRRQITLRYTGSNIGHFDLVVNQDFSSAYEAFYEICRNFNHGNQGSIYLVVDKNQQPPRLIAMKMINTNGQHALNDARNEITTLSQCQHPSIVRYIESFEDSSSSTFVIIQELVHGGDLHNLIKNRRIQTEEQVMFIFAQLLLALNLIHDRGMLHRDIKAENILMQDGTWLKLGDFGFATSSPEITHTSGCTEFCGTPYYLAPELWTKPRDYGQAADIWACGVLLFLMSERQFPFISGHMTGLMRVISSGNIPRLSQTRSTLLNSLYGMLLRQNPADRPRASEMLRLPYVLTALVRLLRAEPPADLRNLVENHLTLMAPMLRDLRQRDYQAELEHGNYRRDGTLQLIQSNLIFRVLEGELLNTHLSLPLDQVQDIRAMPRLNNLLPAFVIVLQNTTQYIFVTGNNDDCESLILIIFENMPR